MEPPELAYPFTGHWQVRNSPANRIPSHGIERFALARAIDFVPVTAAGRSAPVTARSLLRPEPPEAFPGFGRPILAPADGVVVAADDTADDHAAHRGLPSVGYTLTQGRRAAEGWPALAGNHVILRTGTGVHIALCHLQRGSLGVERGETVRTGGMLARCGNSGNSTEPHLHLQAMTDDDAARAEAVPLVLPGGIPRNGTVVEGG